MLISTDTNLTFSIVMKYNKYHLTEFDAHIAWITLGFNSYMMLSLRKRFDDYETMGEVFRDFKNEISIEKSALIQCEFLKCPIKNAV